MKTLLMVSSKGIGLSYHLSRLLVEFKDQGSNVISFSSYLEQEKGLLEQLETKGIRMYKSSSLENFDPMGVWDSARIIRQIIANENITVVHVQGFSQLMRLIVALNYKLRKNIKIVFTLNSYPSDYLFLLLKIYADILIVPSNQAKIRAMQKGISSNKILVVYNWFDIKRFDEYALNNPSNYVSDKERLNVIIYLANFFPWKDHRSLLYAMATVAKNFPQIKLLLLGDGPTQPNIRNLTKTLKLQNNVAFLGRVPYRFVPGILSKADIGVVSSIKETFCHAIIEPMAACKPVISTPVGIAPEVIENGVTGYLVPPKKPSGLEEAIMYLLDHSNKCKAMGNEAREIVKNKFDVKSIASTLSQVYNGLL
jgi:glycosyltransferase involved in cell wall biosynthesis